MTEEGVVTRIPCSIFDQETTWRAKQVKSEHGCDKEVARRLDEIVGISKVNLAHRQQAYLSAAHGKIQTSMKE
jgi:hypothetical protein